MSHNNLFEETRILNNKFNDWVMGDLLNDDVSSVRGYQVISGLGVLTMGNGSIVTGAAAISQLSEGETWSAAGLAAGSLVFGTISQKMLTFCRRASEVIARES